jgi:hypothetical protein
MRLTLGTARRACGTLKQFPAPSHWAIRKEGNAALEANEAME